MNTTKSLQYAFVESHGHPVTIGDWTVQQADRIPINAGRIIVRFIAGQTVDHGVRLRSQGGFIELSDGQRVETLDIWRESDLPDDVEHRVFCPKGELLICNIYRVHHPNDEVTEDMWTGNAGMVVRIKSESKREYGCSSSLGAFDPSELIFEVEWYVE